MYFILNKTGKMPKVVPFHMRNVGLRSIHISSFHMLSALVMTIIKHPILSNPSSNTELVGLYLCYLKTHSENNMLGTEF